MLHFTSKLNPEYNEMLEQLLFFNPGQQSALPTIVDSLEKFGTPSLHIEDDNLRIKLEKLDEVQTLFSMDDEKLVGVLVYSRVKAECLTVIHMVVDRDYSAHGKYAQKMLLMRMIELLRKSARLIKGIKSIRIKFHGNQNRDFSV